MAYSFFKKLFGSSNKDSSSHIMSEEEIDRSLLYTDSFTSYDTKGKAIFRMSEVNKINLDNKNLAESMTTAFVYMWLRRTSRTNHQIYTVLLESLSYDLNVGQNEKKIFLKSCFNLDIEPSNRNLDKLYQKGRGIINLIGMMLPFKELFVSDDTSKISEIVKDVDSKFGLTAEIEGNVIVEPKEIAMIIVRDMHKGLLRQS